MRHGLRRDGLRWAGVFALVLGAALGLAACSASDAADRAGGSIFIGGQTGSLMPLCGVTPGALMRGVPASAAGLVLDPSACADRAALSELAIRDANGQPVAFEVMQLADGTLLVSFANGLTPGSYILGSAAQLQGDDDGGVEPNEPPPFEPDAGLGMQPTVQSVQVQEPAPLPTRFGEVTRPDGACSAELELVPDADVLPYLGLIAVDLQIDSAPTQPLVEVGTLKLEDGRARVTVPVDQLDALWDGQHELRVTARIAGQSAPLETFLLTVGVPCAGNELADDTGALCAARGAGIASARLDAVTLLAPLSALTLYALRKRRRRARA